MTYAPNKPYHQTPMEQALEMMEGEMSRMGVHTLYEGRNLVGGEDMGAALVFVVEDKGPRPYRSEIPTYITTPSGNKIPTDVVANPAPKDLRLRLPNGEARAFAANENQRCWDCPVPAGVQIAPQGKQWVGTLGAALKLPQGYGFLTNEHVSGIGNVGGKCCQPDGLGGWIGEFVATGGIRTDGPNYIDAAVAVCRRTDGPYAPATDLVGPEILGFGPINPAVAKPEVGLQVRKNGRTTGKTTGKIIGVNGVSRVGYDEGPALFRDLGIVQAPAGVFSSPGDSGSGIYTMDNRPCLLLFAGGGGQTLGCRMDYVLDWCKGEFYKVGA